MSADALLYPSGFLPGDRVKVIQGTFAGKVGTVLSPDEAFAKGGGQESVLRRPPGLVWVEITLFERPVALPLEPFQIAGAGP